MKIVNKFLVIVFILLLIIIAVEFFIYYFIKPKTVNKGFYSLNTVQEKSKFFNWLEDNNLITRSKFEVANNKSPFIINDTEGSIKGLSSNKNKKNVEEVLLSIQTKEGVVNFTFPKDNFEVYTKDKILTNLNSLKNADKIIVHEVFSINRNNILPLNVLILKSE